MSGRSPVNGRPGREMSPPPKELDRVLPKLAKRIGTNQTTSPDSANSRSPAALTPTPTPPRPREREREGVFHGENPLRSESNSGRGRSPLAVSSEKVRAPSATHSEEPTARIARSQSASTVTPPRPARTRKGSITFKPEVRLPPEVEELRQRDIAPDIDSAAERALNIAASLAHLHVQGSSHGTGSVSVPGARGGDKDRAERDRDVPVSERRVEGREIQQDHAQYALTYGMMLGIRVCTGRRDVNLDQLSSSKSLTSMMEEQELCAADYDTTHHLVFMPEGNNGPPFPTPPHKLNFTFTFKDYMPNVFRAVRGLSGIEEADYMLSLAGDFNYIEFIANSKSGQFFFYSHDGRYMIKTQTKEECKLLRRIMPEYVKHLTENPDSLLVRFYGMHRVKMKNLQSKTYFVIMSSVFDTPKSIAIKYDLKGSTVGRITPPEECREGAVQKDLNLVQSGRKFRLGVDHIDIFYNTLKNDVMFLRDQNIMDYSLLVGVHDGKTSRPQRRASGVVLAKRQASTIAVNPPSGANNRQMRGVPVLPMPVVKESEGAVGACGSIFQSYYGGIRSSPEVNEIYFMGIIDILQLYNASKRMENFFKGFTHDRKQLSAVDPSLYAERMLDFVMAHSDYPEIMAQRKSQQRAAAGVGLNNGRR